MKSYKEYEELLKDNNITFSSHLRYAEEELQNFLSCEGSDVDSIEPISHFTLDIDNNKYKIGVTSEFDGENYKYTYWLMDWFKNC